jgi:HPt (histidine-containing phosphotransfer) domain-containing protein
MGGNFSNFVDEAVREPASPRSAEATRARASERSSQQMPTAAEVTPPLDRALLTRRCLGRLDLVDRLLKSFASRFPEDLSRIEDRLRANDFEELSRLVHQAKGAAANISAPELHSNMSRLEQALKLNQRETTTTCLAEIHRAWDRFIEFKDTMAPGDALTGRS